MSTPSAGPSHEQQIYWQELFQLKADAFYISEYRNSLNKWVTGVATIRAVTSTGSIAGWLIWKKYAFLWAGLIVVSQISEALKDVFPFYKRRRSLSRWSHTLNKLFVEAQRDWDEIRGGHRTNAQIRKLCHRLRSRKERAEARYTPEGLARKHELFRKAQAEAEEFFLARYTIGDQ